MGMANLSSLVHELRERIAASSTPPSNRYDDDLVIRFRAVLPDLLRASVVPSPPANEREVIAVLKLIVITARHLPGVFYHGKATAILPLLGRILPFFAEPSFRSRHGVIFETVGPLLALLRTGERDAYRQFFIDSMLVVRDILCVASVCADASNITDLTKLTLRCFCESFNGIFDDPDHLGDLPASNKPDDGIGVLINLTGKTRWQPFATWMIKLLGKCLTEGTLYVEGLINMPFVLDACSLLCYGDADLQMACFEFARVVGSGINYDILPHQNIIQSISTILREDKEGFPVFRNIVYDSSLGGCLDALHCNCPEDVVELTAADLVDVFSHSMGRTKSQELKVALCNAYIRIAKICSPNIWRPESLLYVLSYPEPCFSLIDCLQVALSILGPNLVGWRITNSNCQSLSSLSDKSNENLRVGEKRPIDDLDTFKNKRQRVDEDIMSLHSNFQGEHKRTHTVACERENYADYMHKSVLSFVESLEPPGVHPDSLRPDAALRALSMLCIAFCSYPETNLSLSIFRQMYTWMPRVFQQAKQGISVALDISIYLEGINSMLLLQSPLMMESMGFKNKNVAVDLVCILKLPWTYPRVVPDPHPLWKLKCISVQVACKLGNITSTETQLEVLDLSLHDEFEEVIIEAIISMPMIVMWSGVGWLPHISRRLVEFLGGERSEKVKNIIPSSLGFLSCLFGSCNDGDGMNRSRCKLVLNMNNEKCSQTVDYLLQGFWCSECDKSVQLNTESCSKVIYPPDMHNREASLDCDFAHLQSLFLKLLYDESSEEVQVACVKNIRRVVVHGTIRNLIVSRFEWIKCVEYLLLNGKKAVRDAFCTQISSFLEDSFLSCLFPVEDASNKSKEQEFFNIMKHAFSETKDPQIFETLLESTAEIMS